MEFSLEGDNGGELALASGRERLLTNSQMCAAPARDYDYPPTHLHTAVMTGLRAGQRYRYRILGGERAVSVRAPAPPCPSCRLKFVVYGDMGESRHREAKSPG